ncbi:hypothetical protein BT96DRAFT_960793 [Gymnopus androsaceus JB14]|uniref:Uncharacterized protein n=1 Tax=Gymnopus androsaceus JB14 TaxID=1447944 RepID=A0A6A4GIR6_9AGAR|nr:hypothetical protein BT96DRAFT_960793 [Gymnopus androsaceus JB14]
MYQRGREVCEAVLATNVDDLEKWLTPNFGRLYEWEKIRERPHYPHLPHDGKADKRLTGGMMACWCTHSICYGFHCIPVGEGWNDVFSAMITRWPKAPKRVIYDFACALGPYCWTREPQFFADTQFLIDGFHAAGHKKCSTAAFLKTYSEVDASLALLKTSAAECGNSGMARIRKSVSYMLQGHAILYTWVFISIWNRRQIQKLAHRQERLA